ncbi:MAG: magnesium transporter [Peptoniphilaceae bacterium]|nr:magnesium transporter [Peptoniphilaceae bacterium]MCI6659726.1 magnesium transporter [Peptoniphilaceae bacterium]MDD7434098.1 magnesium transporter [Peptoniphilaceae bacterium]MDD7543945.1 magnesium transporter [Peptoniphilaceae bacterium]MDY3075420.1 magnesium transporter [Peptoniphilaceae bacterium]
MAKLDHILQKAMRKLLEEKKINALRDILVTMSAPDLAALFEELGKEELPVYFRLLPKELAAEAFVEMDSEQQEHLIETFSDQELSEILNEIFADDAADLVEEMPANVVNRILSQSDPRLRRDINRLLKYPENSAGSIMTTEYVDLTPQMTVDMAIAHIRAVGVDRETIYACYVTDEKKLVGIVSFRSILLAPSKSTLIGDIMDAHVISALTTTDQEEVAHMMSKYNFLALPIVDSEGRMVGIVTFDDAMDVMEEEVTEDMEIMGGMSPSVKTYLKSSPFDLFRHRIGWLLFLMVSATFTGIIISSFEEALAAQLALVAFIPMLMDTGGNSGSQSSVTIIRALSLHEVKTSDLPKILWKEFCTALLAGSALAMVCFAKIMIVDRLILQNPLVTPMVAFVVCLTMVFTVVVAKLIGSLLPIAAVKMGFDPAVMSSPLLTTIVDALALIIYFGFATAILL